MGCVSVGVSKTKMPLPQGKEVVLALVHFYKNSITLSVTGQPQLKLPIN